MITSVPSICLESNREGEGKGGREKERERKRGGGGGATKKRGRVKNFKYIYQFYIQSILEHTKYQRSHDGDLIIKSKRLYI